MPGSRGGTLAGPFTVKFPPFNRSVNVAGVPTGTTDAVTE